MSTKRDHFDFERSMRGSAARRGDPSRFPAAIPAAEASQIQSEGRDFDPSGSFLRCDLGGTDASNNRSSMFGILPGRSQGRRIKGLQEYSRQ
jgi:hypothetical protein